MGKKIIGNTLIFVFMMGFIVGFNMIFGSENTLIGETTITAVLMFLEKDFSLNPVRTGIKLICFNVLMGVVTFIASKNAILGIPLNFIFVFIIETLAKTYFSCLTIKSLLSVVNKLSFSVVRKSIVTTLFDNSLAFSISVVPTSVSYTHLTLPTIYSV